MEKDTKDSRQNHGLNPLDLINNIQGGIQKIQQIQRIGQLVAKAAPLFTNPFFVAFLIIGILILFILIHGGGANSIGNHFGFGSNKESPSQGGGAGPPGTPPGSFGGLDYYIPFKDPTVPADGLRQTIQTNWPNAHIEHFDNIVSQSIQNGWNPAFVLTLWIEESGGQAGTSYAEGDPDGYTDALGCDPTHPTNDINVSLGCLFGSSFASLSNDQFADFMCQYGGDGIKSPCAFPSNPRFVPGIKDVYTKLIPSGVGALIPATPPAGGTDDLVSCPIPGAIITCGSKFTPRYDCGHCGLNYPDTTNSCSNPNYVGILYAEDVAGNDLQSFIFPTINGHTVDWSFQSQTNGNPGVILNYSGIDEQTQEQYWLEYHHSDSGSQVSSGKSGEIAGRICGNGCGARHTHIEIAKLTSSGREYIDAGANVCTQI